MRIAYIANPDVRIPVEGYGGLERQVEWLSREMMRLGHQVTIFGNVEEGPTKDGWTGVPLSSQNDALNHLDELRTHDVVHDRTKDHVVGRITRTKGYLATCVWSDQPARPATYPSAAVREHFQDPGARVIPECVPTTALPTPQRSDYYLCFGRIDAIKGQDLAVRVAKWAGVKLVVAGHVGRWGDPYYALKVQKMCREAGFEFRPNPSNEEARTLVANARGLIHPHRWLESFSEVVAEALCQGVPVLTTDPGAPKEWVAATAGGTVRPVSDFENPLPDGTGTRWSFFDTDWDPVWIRTKARHLFEVERIAQLYGHEYQRVSS